MSSFLRDGQNKEVLFNLTEQSVIESSLNHSIIESKLSVFGENDSCRLSNCLQSHIFWNFDQISTIYNQINDKNIWFPKVIVIFIMTAQVLFFKYFSEKDPHLNAMQCTCQLLQSPGKSNLVPFLLHQFDGIYLLIK